MPAAKGQRRQPIDRRRARMLPVDRTPCMVPEGWTGRRHVFLLDGATDADTPMHCSAAARRERTPDCRWLLLVSATRHTPVSVRARCGRRARPRRQQNQCAAKPLRCGVSSRPSRISNRPRARDGPMPRRHAACSTGRTVSARALFLGAKNARTRAALGAKDARSRRPAGNGGKCPGPHHQSTTRVWI